MPSTLFFCQKKKDQQVSKLSCFEFRTRSILMMSAAGVTSSEAKEVVEISGSQGGGVIEGQHTTVAKHMDNISSFMMESGQLKVDALKCFADNVAEMKRLEEETDAKAQAFRNLVAMVGMAVGLPNSK